MSFSGKAIDLLCTSYNSILPVIIHFPTSSVMSERASVRRNESSAARERSKQCGASKWAERAVRASRRPSTCVWNHSATWWVFHSSLRCARRRRRRTWSDWQLWRMKGRRRRRPTDYWRDENNSGIECDGSPTRRPDRKSCALPTTKTRLARPRSSLPKFLNGEKND